MSASVCDTTISNDQNSTIYDTEDEAFDKVVPANFAPIDGQIEAKGIPLKFDLKEGEPSSSLPLCLVFNARSIFNKTCSLRNMLNQFGPDLSIILESWEQETKQIKDVLKSIQFKTISYYRKSKSRGGGAAIVYRSTCLPVHLAAVS